MIGWIISIKWCKNKKPTRYSKQCINKICSNLTKYKEHDCLKKVRRVNIIRLNKFPIIPNRNISGARDWFNILIDRSIVWINDNVMRFELNISITELDLFWVVVSLENVDALSPLCGKFISCSTICEDNLKYRNEWRLWRTFWFFD